MNRMEDTLRNLQSLTPPSRLSAEVERAVMNRVLRERTAGSAARRVAVIGAVSLAVLFLVLTISLPRKPIPIAHQAEYVESVILLDDHVCIWLEPVNGTTAKEKP
ncbi:hypothetical protein KJ815_12730 [bacterium]|nr:hypothetical protein [bacterium]